MSERVPPKEQTGSVSQHGQFVVASFRPLGRTFTADSEGSDSTAARSPHHRCAAVRQAFKLGRHLTQQDRSPERVATLAFSGVLLAGRDVRVESEEVGWVVLVLQRDQPLVVATVRSPDSVFAFLP
jgi:hypothetical protein